MKDTNSNVRNLASLLIKNLPKLPDTKQAIQEFDSVDDPNGLSKATNAYNDTWYFSLHRLINSEGKIWGKTVVFIKKIIRRVLQWYIRPLFEDQLQFNHSATWAMNEIVLNLDSIKDVIAQIKQKERIQDSAMQEVIKHVESIDYTMTQIKREDNLKDFDYLRFENKYRGQRSEICNKQSIYLPYFAKRENVLDIGCGRGEFVELMAANNISVQGIDTDEDMVAYCQSLGLPVHLGEARYFLEALPDNSLGGIFLGHVIEHLKPQVLIDLIRIAYKKLQPDACFVAESPNPLNLGIFSSPFYIDITHVKPVHPETLRFMLETSGFRILDTHFLSPIPEGSRLHLLEDESPKTNVLNQNFNKLNDLLFGCQDYSVIAQK